jgi:tetratricopeptide (TPR) repeat protein
MTRFWIRGLVFASLAIANIGANMGTAQAAWWQAKSQHFTVYREGSDDKLRDFAVRLEKFDFLLRTITRVTDPEKGSPVKVYLLSTEGKVHDLAGNPNIGGFYTTSDRTAYAVLSRGAKTSKFDFGAEEILFHEYTHHFMLHHFPAAYPAWYVEGFAEFFSIVKFPDDGSIEFGHVPLARAPGLVLGSPYPVENLFARNTDGLSLRDGDRYYGTAWLLTHYFQYKPDRRAEIARYLNDVANGVKDIVPDSYFAGGLAALDKDLEAYMRHRLSASRLTPKELVIGEITTSPVDPAQAALMEDELVLMGDPNKEEAPRLAASIRATAAKYPANAYAAALLAEAEWTAEQADAALAAADRAIALDPKSARGHAVRARVLLERAHDSDKAEDWKAALTSIVRANRADTEDPVPLSLFYRYHAMRGAKMPDIGYDGLYKAFTLLPQSPEYRVAFVHAVAARGDFKTASILLDPLAYSPHPSSMRDNALQLKAQFDAKVDEKGDAKTGAAPAGNAAPAS